MSTRRQFSGARSRGTAFHQILIILVGSMLLGDSKQVPLAEAVEESVEEGPRRERAIEIAGRLDAMSPAIVERLVGLHDQFYEVLDDADLERETLRASLDAMVDHLHTADLEAVELRFLLASQLSAEEWEKVWEAEQAAGDWKP
jgi:hypothetical protein